MLTVEKPAIKKRSKGGCHTCKKRRRKCDETHPVCLTCQEGGHHCEGYEVRLRWNVGVASRGHLTGAPIPDPDAAPPRVKGRQRDLSNSAQKRSFDIPDDTPEISPEDQNYEWTLTPSSSQSKTSSPADYHDTSTSSLSTARALQKVSLFDECR